MAELAAALASGEGMDEIAFEMRDVFICPMRKSRKKMWTRFAEKNVKGLRICCADLRNVIHHFSGK